MRRDMKRKLELRKRGEFPSLARAKVSLRVKSQRRDQHRRASKSHQDRRNLLF